MDTLLLIAGVLACVGLIHLILEYFSRKKLKRIIAEISSEHSVVQSKCMMRENGVSAPGVAQISHGRLIARNVLGKKVEVPLEEISAVKEHLGLGKTGWVGKRVFELKSPKTCLFALGFRRDDADAWRKELGESIGIEIKPVKAYAKAILLGLAFVPASLLLGNLYFRSHEVYKQSVKLAQTHEEVVALLGEPIKASYFFRGSVRNMGHASFKISFRGPNGKGSLLTAANKRQGEWRFAKAVFSTPSREINLLEEASQ